jgi:hypothetical protein
MDNFAKDKCEELNYRGSSEAAKTKAGHILLGPYLQNFFNYYLVFMCR